MLIKAKTIKGYKLHSKDGEIGKVKEFYFDDDYWTVRYLVAETGNWLVGRQVLISPHALGIVNKEELSVIVNLTKKQIEDSPSLDNKKPVSRQFEEEYHGYYGLPMYWANPNMLGASPYIGIATVKLSEKLPENKQAQKKEDSHLRSTHDVIGHNIRAKDGEIGHVDDFIIDDKTWEIRYLVIDTKNWWPGKRVLISPHWISDINWASSEVYVHVPLETIKNAPEYLDDTELTDEYEVKIKKYYNQASTST